MPEGHQQGSSDLAYILLVKSKLVTSFFGFKRRGHRSHLLMEEVSKNFHPFQLSQVVAVASAAATA